MVDLTPSAEEWKRLQSRVARLGGGYAILKIGAHSKPELSSSRQQAEKAFRVLTGMLVDGVVPGGGVAYLACALAVEAIRECSLCLVKSTASISSWRLWKPRSGRSSTTIGSFILRSR